MKMIPMAVTAIAISLCSCEKKPVLNPQIKSILLEKVESDARQMGINKIGADHPKASPSDAEDYKRSITTLDTLKKTVMDAGVSSSDIEDAEAKGTERGTKWANWLYSTDPNKGDPPR